MSGINSDTKLMLHFDGSDESTTITDSSPSEHTCTANAGAAISTDQYKWGSSSLWLPTGSNPNYPYVITDASHDFDLFGNNTDDWTVDFWIRTTEVDDTLMICGQAARIYTGNWWRLYKGSGGSLTVDCVINDAAYVFQQTTTDIIEEDTWCHVALITVGGVSNRDIGVYIDGDQLSFVNVSTSQNFGLPLNIGSCMLGNVEGYIDEFRVQKSNIFSAAPNSDKDDTITVPTKAYSEDSDITAKNQSIIIL